MTGNDKEYTEKIQQAFDAVLNRHGYGFHYAVLSLADNLYEGEKSSWYFETAEFPVESQGNSTRIDFILRLHDKFSQGQHIPYFLLAECKRVNPSLSNWCFAKAPYVVRQRGAGEPYFIEQFYQDQQGIGWASTQRVSHSLNAFHIALEVKTGEQGDNSGQGRGAIEEALTQILRGMNGMIESVSKNPQILGDKRQAKFIPVIFTTAQLWSTEARISNAEIETGKIDLMQAGFQQQKWLTYQYHQSPGLKHHLPSKNKLETLGDILDGEYIRSVFIVNTSGIEDFLAWAGRLHWG